MGPWVIYCFIDWTDPPEEGLFEGNFNIGSRGYGFGPLAALMGQANAPVGSSIGLGGLGPTGLPGLGSLAPGAPGSGGYYYYGSGYMPGGLGGLAPQGQF